MSCDHYKAERRFGNNYDVDYFPRTFNSLSRFPDDELPGMSRKNQDFLNIVETGVTTDEKGNLEITLTLNRDIGLSNSKWVVCHRTKNTLHRIGNDPVMSDKCMVTMQKYLDFSHVEEFSHSVSHRRGD